MNILKITQSNKSFIMEFNTQKLIILNEYSLRWHLRRQVGLDKTAIASILHMFEYENVVEVDISTCVRNAA